MPNRTENVCRIVRLFQIYHGYTRGSLWQYFQLELLPVAVDDLLWLNSSENWRSKAAPEIEDETTDPPWMQPYGSPREVSPPSDHRWRFFVARFIPCAWMAVGRIPESWKLRKGQESAMLDIDIDIVKSTFVNFWMHFIRVTTCASYIYMYIRNLHDITSAIYV